MRRSERRARSSQVETDGPLMEETAVRDFQTIVVAIDFSETSRAALRRATQLAREANGTLHVVHVVPMPVYAAWSVEAPDLEAAGIHAYYVEDARRQLVDLTATLAIEPSRVTCTALPGRPAQEIVRYATEIGASLIVLGTHGHGFVNRMLLGSVADHVVRHAPCAVLVVPPVTSPTAVAA
jgi:nucleotide-binding universal stress UspA family protein